MIPQVFLEYMTDNGYRDVSVKPFKKHDRVRFYMTERTGWPNTEYCEVTLKKHIGELEPRFYPEVAMPIDHRDLIHCAEFLARCMALESGVPYLPVYYSERCDRCGRMETDWLYPGVFEDDFGETVERILCGDCDHEVMNGGDPLLDRGRVWELRNP